MGDQETMHPTLKQTDVDRRHSVIKDVPLKVLMIEDDEQYYRFARRVLLNNRAPKFTVENAGNLDSALKYLEQQSPDAILLDLNLPGSKGLVNLERVRNAAPAIPIIILTGNDDTEFGPLAVSCGAQDYLLKFEVSDRALPRCVHYAVERRRSENAILRLTAIQDFVETLAHDLQVPLIGASLVFDELLSERPGTLSAVQLHMVNELKKSNSGQLKRIQKLLQVYNYDINSHSLVFQRISMQGLVSKVFNVDDVSVETYPDSAPEFWGDQSALLTLFSNLVENALLHRHVGTKVTVQITSQGEKIVTRIHNYGPPIPVEMQLGLSEKFWHGVPGQHYVAHTGTGLYMCHRIVSLHGGRLICDSREGEGTTITVTLPAFKSSESTFSATT
jgi:sigma-B regulation protein RsbU (phosphoserine phosphatase)